MPDLVVVVCGGGTDADQRRTLDSLERATPELEVCLLDGDSTDAGSVGRGVARAGGVLAIASQSPRSQLPEQVAWEVVQGTPTADVVLVDIGVTVGPGWRERLHSAAYADAVVATSSAIPADLLELEDASDGIRLPSGDLRGTSLGEPLPGCVYIRRDALNVATNARSLAVDPRSASLPPLRDVVLVPGLVHVLAACVVEPAPGPRPRDRSAALTPAVRRAVAELEAAIGALRVTIDLRCCAFPLTGTQVHALNLVASLAAGEQLQLSALVPARVHESVRTHLQALPRSVILREEGDSSGPPPHVFHRPYQVLGGEEVTDVVSAGVRLVVTHQDLILDRTPAYFASRDDWRRYTSTTAMTLVAADEVVFFSEHARREAVRDGLVDRGKTSVVPPGTDHLEDAGAGLPPEALAGARSPFVLVIGNAYAHKNRLFALRVLEELRRTHGWGGRTVFAGGRPGDGSSNDDEAYFLSLHPELQDGFHDLGHVTDEERRWLYRHAALVLYPSLYEGFGLVPFEAAAAGTPCAYSSRSSVAEFLPAEGALLELGDVEETARRLIDVLATPEAGAAIVRAVRLSGSTLTWQRAADSYREIYRRALTRPVGLSLVSGADVIVGPTARMVSTETERRLVAGLRRSAAARLLARGALALVIGLRRTVQRLTRPARP